MELRIIILSGAQSHICKCKKQQFCKTGNIKKKNSTAGSISKVTN